MRNDLQLADFPHPDTATIERQVLSDLVCSPEMVPAVQGFVNLGKEKPPIPEERGYSRKSNDPYINFIEIQQ